MIRLPEFGAHARSRPLDRDDPGLLPDPAREPGSTGGALPGSRQRRQILLSPAGASEIERPSCAPLERVEIRLNGSSKPIAVAIEPDPWLKTRVELPRATTVRELEVRIVAPARDAGKLAGLAEIELR